MLEELYFDTIVRKDETYNISFLFEILYLKFKFLNLLWVEAHQHNLYCGKEERKCHEVGTEVDDSISKNNLDNVAWKYKFRKLFFKWYWLHRYALSKYFARFEELWGADNQEMKFEILDEPNPYMKFYLSNFCQLFISTAHFMISTKQIIFSSLYWHLNWI